MERGDRSGGHIIIGGTGRAGTTLLVQLFGALGFDVGFSPEKLADIDPVSHAGLEHSPVRYWEYPLVVKSPAFSASLRDLLTQRLIKVRSVIVPVRNIKDAAESRRQVTAKGSKRGALWGTVIPSEQEAVLLGVFHELICTVAEYGLPHVFIAFPLYVRDPDYAFRQLEPVLSNYGVSGPEFLAAFAKVVRPDLVSDFGFTRPPPLIRPRKESAVRMSKKENDLFQL
jgi:hypothetical protein